VVEVMSITMGYLCFIGECVQSTCEGFLGLEGLVGCTLNFVYPVFIVDFLSLKPEDTVTDTFVIAAVVVKTCTLDGLGVFVDLLYVVEL